jgi:hypothetical protein
MQFKETQLDRMVEETRDVEMMGCGEGERERE